MDGNAALKDGVARKVDDVVVYRDNDGIVVVDYGTQIVDLAAAKRSNSRRRALRPQGPEPVLMAAESARGVRSDLVEYSASEEVCEITSALALIARSKVAEVIGNVFISFHKNPYPTRLFTDEMKARAWLLEVTDKR